MSQRNRNRNLAIATGVAGIIGISALTLGGRAQEGEPVQEQPEVVVSDVSEWPSSIVEGGNPSGTIKLQNIGEQSTSYRLTVETSTRQGSSQETEIETGNLDGGQIQTFDLAIQTAGQQPQPPYQLTLTFRAYTDQQQTDQISIENIQVQPRDDGGNGDQEPSGEIELKDISVSPATQ